MKRRPRPQLFNFIKKSAAVILALEVGLFGGVYYVYHRMNTDRDFRHYLSNNYTFALEAFYSVGEYFNKQDQTRRFDQMIWSTSTPVGEAKHKDAADKQ